MHSSREIIAARVSADGWLEILAMELKTFNR
jgi:hypothetical protein